MKQNLVKAICPACRNKIFSIIGWVKIINKKAVPDNLPEENCPECALDAFNKIRLGAPVIVL